MGPFRVGDLSPEDLAVMRQLLGPMPPPEFVTDGCTHCPDHDPVTGGRLYLACAKHDWAYDALCFEIPDTPQGRLLADGMLWENVQLLGLEEDAADAIWLGVRAGGASHFKRG